MRAERRIFMDDWGPLRPITRQERQGKVRTETDLALVSETGTYVLPWSPVGNHSEGWMGTKWDAAMLVYKYLANSHF